MEMEKRIKVVVGMSGGVDSSVAAAMLCRRGFEVVGIHLKLWSESGENRCCSLSDEQDARAVAAKLGIPFYVYDLSKEFKKIIIDYFLDEYAHGRTPNPCTLCNREIRFGLMLKKAKELGADFLATGHYARVARVNHKSQITNHKSQTNIKSQTFKMMRGKDLNKDQSYMLALVRPEDLRYAMFPLGEMTKSRVRKLAEKWGIKTATKRDSQEVCFVADNYRDFLARHIANKIKPGDIIDRGGRVIGKHLGLPLYTIGQRKGFEVRAQSTRPQRLSIAMAGEAVDRAQKNCPLSTVHCPLYVVGMDVKKNRLVVGEGKELYTKEMVVEKMNWLMANSKWQIANGKKQLTTRLLRRLAPRNDIRVQIRYHHEPASGKFVMVEQLQVKIRFDKPQKALTPGQTAVFYKGNQVLGGGIIKSSE